MKLARDISLKIHYILDQWIPPALRDCRWFMAVPLWMAYKNHTKTYLDFKEQAFRLSEKEFCDIYRKVSNAVERPTDLNKLCIEKVKQHIRGNNVLEVGCGRGYLSKLLSDKHRMTAVDIALDPVLVQQNPHITFKEANTEDLPFPDKYFDTVICTHTLEHVRNVSKAVQELRRVGKFLIIVVPRQRPYKYTFDLHLNFFPYTYSLLSVLGKTEGDVICEDADGDIFYAEETE